MTPPDYSLHAKTARLVAAWIKAYGVEPTAVELGKVAGISTAAAGFRMRTAYTHGFLRRIPMRRDRRYAPVWELLPRDLQEQRPAVIRPPRKHRSRYPLQPWAD